uniref:Uncharacterized protein n=1 Tax=Anguilla anguilla TaxID=7936 RepID=A0A0E9TWY1_ANGAN
MLKCHKCHKLLSKFVCIILIDLTIYILNNIHAFT